MTGPSKPPIPQITLFLDDSGTIHAETPGLNGFRQKIDLPSDPKDWGNKIQSELSQIAWHMGVFERERKADAKEQARKLKLRKEALDKQRDAEIAEAKARKIYLRTASDHGIPLANRVIDDPKRRPRRGLTTPNGVVYYPRRDGSASPNKPNRNRPIDQSLVVDIEV